MIAPIRFYSTLNSTTMKAVLSKQEFIKFNLINGLLTLDRADNPHNMIAFSHLLGNLYLVEPVMLQERDLVLAGADTLDWARLVNPSKVSESQWETYLETLQPHQQEFVKKIVQSM